MMRNGFKEWALVCEALGSGRQSIILRKGGIAEGRDGFRFLHPEFALFPTWFHEQLDKTTLDAATALPVQDPETITLRYVSVVEWTKLVTDRHTVLALRDHHILQESVVLERFEYDEPKGVHVAFVRVYRLEPPLQVAYEKRFGGCRSWVELPDWDGSALVSVISDEEHRRRKASLEVLLGPRLAFGS